MRKTWMIGYTFIFIFICTFPTFGSAWSHGYPIGNTFAYTPVDYFEPQHYGIYDWFAEQVLRQIKVLYSAYDDFWFQYWQNEIRFGTELITNSKEASYTLVINQTEIIRCENESNYYIQWINGSLPLNQAYFVRGELILTALLNALSLQKYDVASIYLGMFCAFFSLTTFFPSFSYNEQQLYGQYFSEMNIDLYYYRYNLTYPLQDQTFSNLSFSTASVDVALQTNNTAILWYNPLTNQNETVTNQWLINIFGKYITESSYDFPDLMMYYITINRILNYGINVCANLLYTLFANNGLRLTAPILNPYTKTVRLYWQPTLIISGLFGLLIGFIFYRYQQEQKRIRTGYYWKKQMGLPTDNPKSPSKWRKKSKVDTQVSSLEINSPK